MCAFRKLSCLSNIFFNIITSSFTHLQEKCLCLSSLRNTETSSANFILFTSQSGLWKSKTYQPKLNFYQSVASWLPLEPSPGAVLRIERSGFKPQPGHCVVFLGKTLYSYSGSLHPGVYMGTAEFTVGGNPAIDQHLIHWGVEILLQQSLHAKETGISSGSDRPLGLYKDFTFLPTFVDCVAYSYQYQPFLWFCWQSPIKQCLESIQERLVKTCPSVKNYRNLDKKKPVFTVQCLHENLKI